MRGHAHAFVIASVPADFREGWASVGQEVFRESRALLYPV